MSEPTAVNAEIFLFNLVPSYVLNKTLQGPNRPK